MKRLEDFDQSLDQARYPVNCKHTFIKILHDVLNNELLYIQERKKHTTGHNLAQERRHELTFECISIIWYLLSALLLYADKNVLHYREVVIPFISLCQNDCQSCDGADTCLLDTLVETIEELVLEIRPDQLSVIDDPVHWVCIDHKS